MKKINLSLTLGNKTFYTLIGIVSLFLIAGVVYAYNLAGTGNPAVMGHTIDEIAVIDEDGNAVPLE